MPITLPNNKKSKTCRIENLIVAQGFRFFLPKRLSRQPLLGKSLIRKWDVYRWWGGVHLVLKLYQTCHLGW